MRYFLFGRSGLRVSEVCLGAMTFGGGEPWRADVAESRAIFDAFAEAGGTFIDTADAYAGGESERLVGEFTRADRDHFVIATKYTQGNDISTSGNSRKNMIRALDASLKRIGCDHVDLFWLHLWDYTTQPDELMRAFDDIVSSGKARYIGASDTPAWEISRANMMADLRGWTPFSGIQVEYNLLERSAERDLLPMARTLDLAVTAWSPIAGGRLAQTPSQDASARAQAGRLRPLTEHGRAIVDLVLRSAQAAHCPPAAVALAWMRQSTRFPRIIPILGARTAAQLRQNLSALDVTLDQEVVDALSEASKIDPGFPYTVIHQPNVRAMVTGGATDQLVNHRT